MKSAVEIAMERAGCTEKSVPVLNSAQKERLAEERNIYRGKIAEAEIMYQSEVSRFEGGAVEGDVQLYLDQKREELIERKRELNGELEKKIEEIREPSKGRQA